MKDLTGNGNLNTRTSQELLDYLLQDFKIHSMKPGLERSHHPEYNFIRK